MSGRHDFKLGPVDLEQWVLLQTVCMPRSMILFEINKEVHVESLIKFIALKTHIRPSYYE